MPVRLLFRLYAWCIADKNRSIKYGIAAAVLVLGILLFVLDYRASVREIQGGLERNDYGEGSALHELEIEVENSDRLNLEIEVFEQKYQKEQVEEWLETCSSQVAEKMLGENESPDKITSNLNLMTTLDHEPVEISWKLDNYDVMNIYGEIHEENVSAAGNLVNLEAVITYTEDPTRQIVYESAVMVYPKERTQEEAMVKEIQDWISKENVDTQTEKKLDLPETMDGKKIAYYEKRNLRGLVLIVMALLSGILFYAQEIQNEGKKLQEKRRQMLADYPEIINKLTLFLGAGMTTKRAFAKIVNDYEMEKKHWGIRYAYEEMKMACREMESNFVEAECYERFGRRCNMQEYIRLGSLLSQNVRKGTKGLSHILRIEALQAFENRKAQAKKAGEEAATKLLIPMFLMLAVVLVMVIVPAFLSLQV